MHISTRSTLLAAALGGVILATSSTAAAFCGFFVSGADAALTNNASQVAMLRKGNRTVLTMSNNYQGPPENFAMVVPVPVVLQKEQVKTLAPDVFKHIDQLSAPRLVEYWEQDPCYIPPPVKYKPTSANKGGAVREEAMDGARNEKYGVKIEAKFEVGEYQVLILSAKESGGLTRWLLDNKYKIPSGAASALAPYVRDQFKFFVAKVNIKKVRRDSHGFVVLSPLRFSYDSAELRLPVRLGLLNAPKDGKAAQDLIVYILHPDKRFETANYRNVFIPTNIEVVDDVRKRFGSFYAELFDETLRRNNQRAVITEYAWQTSSCDPCPTPPLGPSDLYTLGGDEVGESKPTRSEESQGYWNPSSWVLTRLHTRYSPATLTEDLIFHEAAPVTGGRADGNGGLGDHGAKVEKGGENNFQGRYIIRHYWEGAVACKNPIYGRWGGPPANAKIASDGSGVRAAEDLANAPRGQLKLSTVVRTAVPSLGLAAKPFPLRPGEKPESRNAPRED